MNESFINKCSKDEQLRRTRRSEERYTKKDDAGHSTRRDFDFDFVVVFFRRFNSETKQPENISQRYTNITYLISKPKCFTFLRRLLKGFSIIDWLGYYQGR